MNRKPITVADAERIGQWTPPDVLDELMRLATGKSVIVELGSWLGRSAMALAQGNAKVYCVDTWAGSPQIGTVENPLALYRQFLRNVHLAGIGHKIVPLFMQSDWGAQWFDQTPIDLLFVDGDHSPNAVWLDLECWVPRLAKHGIICGDDYGEVKAIVHAFFDASEWRIEARARNRLWIAERLHA